MSDEALTLDADELISTISKFNTGDSERASDAGTARQKIGEFLEETGINGKAFSHARQLLKMKKETQKLDYLRSMEAILPALAAHVRGQSTMDAFDVPKAAKAAADQAESPEAIAKQFAAPSYKEDLDLEDDETGDGDDSEDGLDEDEADFNAAADEALDDTVVPFDRSEVAAAE